MTLSEWGETDWQLRVAVKIMKITTLSYKRLNADFGIRFTYWYANSIGPHTLPHNRNFSSFHHIERSCSVGSRVSQVRVIFLHLRVGHPLQGGELCGLAMRRHSVDAQNQDRPFPFETSLSVQYRLTYFQHTTVGLSCEMCKPLGRSQDEETRPIGDCSR